MKQRSEHTQKIIDYIRKHPTKSADDLVQKFNISKSYAYKLRTLAQAEDVKKAPTRKLYVPLAAALVAKKMGLSVEEYVKRTREADPKAFEETNDLTPQEEENTWTATTTDEGNIVATHSEPTKVDTILDQRATQYGKFIEGAEVMQTLKQVVRTSIQKRGTALAFDQLESIDMIIHKLGRIINGNPDNVDSWRDIAGYATLVADRLEGNVR